MNLNCLPRFVFLASLASSLGLVTVAPVWTAESDPAAAGAVPLIAPDSLAGWQVTNCQATVENGVLRILEGNGFVRSDHQYADFVLELEYRPLKDAGWDSGIYFRCEKPTGARPWPKRYQVNLKEGQEGNLIGVPDATTKGLVKPGEWNRMRLRVEGHQASLEINDQPAWTTSAIEPLVGYIGLQVEVPLGGQFEFKNMTVTELGYHSLFNGRDLAGWEGAGKKAELCWTVQDGLLVCTGEKGPWLRSLQQYDDFNLRLDYQLREGGNSGVFVRVPADGNHHGRGAGVEIQLLDDLAPRYARLNPYQYTGSVYAIAPAMRHVGRPPGDWNTIEINCLGHSYTIVHNGVVIVAADLENYPQLEERLLQGYLGLQNHSEEVAFRNLRIGPALPPQQLAPAGAAEPSAGNGLPPAPEPAAPEAE